MMKKLTALVIFALAIACGTLAKADTAKPDDDDANALQAFRALNRHHPHGFHLKYVKDPNDPRIDLDDFILIGSKSKSVQVTSESADSNSSSDGVAGNVQNGNDADGDPPTLPSSVPEQGTLILVGMGLLLTAVALRKRMSVR
jgi:hypothetical protein